MNSLHTDLIRHIRPIFPGLGRGLDLLLPSFLLSREEKKVLAGLRLFPKEDKYGHSDSIIRSSRIVCGAYAFALYKRGSAPRPHLLYLSPIGAICGAYAIRPYVGGCAPHTPGRGRQHPPPLNGLMRSVIQVCGSAVGARGVGEGRYGACLGLKWSTCHLLI